MVVGLVVVFCGSRENAVPNSLSSAMGAGCGEWEWSRLWEWEPAGTL